MRHRRLRRRFLAFTLCHQGLGSCYGRVCSLLFCLCFLALCVENVGIHLREDLARCYKVTFIGADVYNSPRSLCCDIDLRRLDTPIAACKTLRQTCRLQFFPSEIGGNPKYDHDYQQQPLWNAPCAGRFWLLAIACWFNDSRQRSSLVCQTTRLGGC